MYTLLSSLNLFHSFPNDENGLQIYLCMMMSNAIGKRSFSKLEIVEELRSSTGQESLSMALTSIQHEVLCSLDYTHIIDEVRLVKV